jgi:hypothetical protein
MTTACTNTLKDRFVHQTTDHGITLRQGSRREIPSQMVRASGRTYGRVQVGSAVPVEMAAAAVARALKEETVFLDAKVAAK